MTIQAPSISWPTRNNWAAGRQPEHPDGHLPWKGSWTLSAYATSAEIADLIRALQQVHETQAGGARRQITEAIKTLRKDTLPYLPAIPEAQRLLEPMRRRQQDAHELHKKAWSQHRDARPVDDAAWEAELQRRATIESEFAAAWNERMKLEAEKEAA